MFCLKESGAFYNLVGDRSWALRTELKILAKHFSMQNFQYFLLLAMDKAKKHKGEWKLQIWKHELGFQTQTKVRECLNLSIILDQPIIVMSKMQS